MILFCVNQTSHTLPGGLQADDADCPAIRRPGSWGRSAVGVSLPRSSCVRA